jgi:hypothetical protein
MERGFKFVMRSYSLVEWCVLVGFVQVSRWWPGDAILCVAPGRLPFQTLDWIGSSRADMTSFPKRSAKTAHLLRQFSRIAGYFRDAASIERDVGVLAGKRPACARLEGRTAPTTWLIVAGPSAFPAWRESSRHEISQDFCASNTRSTHVVSTRPEMKSASRKIRR